MRKAFIASASLGMLLPLLVLAQAGITPLPTGPQSVSGVVNLIEKIADVLFTVLLVVAVIMILWAAFNYLTAMGNPEKVKSANSILIYAAVAIAVATLAKGVPIIVRSIVG